MTDTTRPPVYPTLTQAIDDLTATVDAFEAALSPVLLPDFRPTPPLPNGYASPLGHQVGRIEALRTRLADLNFNLDL